MYQQVHSRAHPDLFQLDAMADLAIIGGSFQGMHTRATGDNVFWFWVTVFLGDLIRISGHNSIVHAIRDFVLTFFTLLNSSPSNSGLLSSSIVVASFVVMARILRPVDDHLMTANQAPTCRS